MIVRMARVAVIGPKEDLMDVLALIGHLGILQVEKEPPEKISRDADENRLQTLRPDREILAQRLLFEELLDKISALLSLLAPYAHRQTYLSPENILDSIKEVIDQQLRKCRDWLQRQEALRRDINALQRFKGFTDALAPLLPARLDSPNLDYIGIEISSRQNIEDIDRLGTLATGGRFQLETAATENGAIIGLITTEKEFVAAIQKALQDKHTQDFSLPTPLQTLSFPERIREADILLQSHHAESADLEKQITAFAYHWKDIYQQCHAWLSRRLALIKTTGLISATGMCFVISGWLPTADLAQLSEQLARRFNGRVVVEQKELREEDLARAPIQLRNRGYFQPFELLTRILPLPRYGSFDLTPFVAIFFPLFFGLMLGDMGYGILLAALALGLVILGTGNLRDVGKISGVAALYTIIFGGLFGECFGVLGNRLFGLRPLLLNRHESILPMLYFALALGFVHIVVGLVLGAISSCRQKEQQEAVFKIGSIVMLFCLALLLFTRFSPATATVMEWPLLLIVGIAIPVLFITGGLLAPLEVLKHIGNIISYARIMAIGLTSVLLAHVANTMAGMMGSIWLGIVIAILLHGFNIVLGIFAPTIHALRLHYVEFFSKIMSSGGHQYRPLGKE